MSELVVLLDLGSNAARFVLTRISEGLGFRIIKQERVQTRLGSSTRGHLPADAVDATLQAVRRFLRAVGNGSRPRVVAVATAAVREALNRDRLLEPLRRLDGVEVRVLSGHQEARLGALAALESLPIRDGAVADLGGGSLQLSRVRGGRPIAFVSLPLGALRLTRRFFRHDPRDRARDARAPRRDPIGGTIRTLARIHLAVAAGRRRARHGAGLCNRTSRPSASGWNRCRCAAGAAFAGSAPSARTSCSRVQWS